MSTRKVLCGVLRDLGDVCLTLVYLKDQVRKHAERLEKLEKELQAPSGKAKA